MRAHSFRSMVMVASCAGAALGCYLVSLRVASERAALEQVETQIVLAERDIRLLQTEIGTRGRLAQLERWNVRVLALSAPSADQFVNGGFELARLVTPQKIPAVEAPVVLAAAPADAQPPQLERQVEADDTDRAVPTRELLRTASLKQPERESTPVVKLEAQKPRTDAKRASRPALEEPVKPAAKTPAKPSPTTAKKVVDKKAAATSRPMTKPVKLAKTDPLAPLPSKTQSTTAKDSGPAR